MNTSPRTASGLALDTLQAYGGGLVHNDIVFGLGIVLIVLALLGFALSFALTAERTASSLALLMWLVPLGLVLALGLRNGLFEVRYLVLSLPGMMLLAGLA